MLLTADLILQFQRCSRRAFLDTHGDPQIQDPRSDYLSKIIKDSQLHRRQVLNGYTSDRIAYPPGDWHRGAQATQAAMAQGVAHIENGVLLVTTDSGITLLSRPDLLTRYPGQSTWGNWCYALTNIKLGKRPKLEYQLAIAFDAYVLATLQGEEVPTAGLILREKGWYEVDLDRVQPQMEATLAACIETLQAEEAPAVFIARNRCGLCPWLSHCYEIAQAEAHLSLLPGVTPNRYAQLKLLGLTTVEALATSSVASLEMLPGFGPEVAEKMVRQAQATLHGRAIARIVRTFNLHREIPTAGIELYFDIEAEPDMNLAYLLGVLAVDRAAGQHQFHALLAETPEEEGQVWQKFLDLVGRYPHAPIFHFCPYEATTIKRLGELYNTPESQIEPILHRCVDLHDRTVRTVTLPVESYALKSIARWLGFTWRDSDATGAQAVCWYGNWLATGDRTHLTAITRYNEDDCWAMYHLKNWLIEFLSPALAHTA